MLFPLLSNESVKRSRGKLPRYGFSLRSFSDSLSILISVGAPHAYPLLSPRGGLGNVNLRRHAKSIAYNQT